MVELIYIALNYPPNAHSTHPDYEATKEFNMLNHSALFKEIESW